MSNRRRLRLPTSQTNGLVKYKPKRRKPRAFPGLSELLAAGKSVKKT